MFSLFSDSDIKDVAQTLVSLKSWSSKWDFLTTKYY